MTAQLLDGRVVAAKIKARIIEQLKDRQQRGLEPPGLAVILVGHDPASMTYVHHKRNACAAVGIRSSCYHLAEDSTQIDIERCIDRCNEDTAVHGILLQLPLPHSINALPLLERIRPDKDVDGFHPYNMGRLAQSHPRLRPCTPKGVMTLLRETNQDLTGLDAVVVGASNIVGRPMALELLMAECTVSVCHCATRHLDQWVQRADLLISATGQAELIQGEWIKPGAIAIDVGFSRSSSGAIRGDFVFDAVRQRAAWVTPVPGGVGPMTIAALLENTLQAAELQDSKSF